MKLRIRQIFKLLFESTFITIISSLVFVFFLASSSLLFKFNKNMLVIFVIFSFIFGLVITPIIILHYFYSFFEIKIRIAKILRFIIEFLIIYLFLRKISFPTIIIGIFIAICEEILFRFLLYDYIKVKSNEINAILINSLLFGLILHINDNLIINVLIRFPLGILLSLIKKFLSLSESIILHWVYNILNLTI